MEENYLEVNKETWNKRTEVHVDSEFYDNASFIDGRSSLNDIELELLGDIRGKKVLHLQCHFGQDSISLSRLGAEVTGVDFSDVAIEKAKELAIKTGENTKFICCDVYGLTEVLSEQFDIVFTSYGTIGWLPDIMRWGRVVASFLNTGGYFVFAEFHPMVWMFDSEFKKIQYNYFNIETIIEQSEGTYTDGGEKMKNTEISWNHPLSDVMNSLISSGLEIRSMTEYDYSPYNCFKDMKEISSGKYIIPHLDRKLPMVYSIKAVIK
jgi:2-polyprenyl-3-methyl-5-hydroxy-6-metoxy-1,4-benzoquinol methylase